MQNSNEIIFCNRGYLLNKYIKITNCERGFAYSCPAVLGRWNYYSIGAVRSVILYSSGNSRVR